MAFFNNDVNKAGTYFVAYCGTRIDPLELNRAMSDINDNKQKYTLKIISETIAKSNEKVGIPRDTFREGITRVMYMAKIVPTGRNTSTREPYRYGSGGDEVWTESAYKQDELERFYKKFYSEKYEIADPSFYHSFINSLFMYEGFSGLTELANNQFHFCTAIANMDKSTDKYELIGFATTPTDEYGELFFGIPDERDPEDFLITNSMAIVKKFCPEAYKLRPYHYILNGKIYDMDGMRKFKEFAVVPGILSASSYTEPLRIPTTKDIMDSLNDDNSNEEKVDSKETSKIEDYSIKSEEPTNHSTTDDLEDELSKTIEELKKNSSSNTPDNSPVNSTALDVIREKDRKDIEQKLLLYILPLVESDETKAAIRKVIEGQASSETIKKVNEIIQKAIDESKISDVVSKMISKIVDEKVKEYTDKIEIPKVNIIQLNNKKIGVIKGEHLHERFKDILSLVVLDEPVMLIGPAGAGKNHTIGQIGKVLAGELEQNRIFYTNCASNEFKLTGFTDAGGTYRDTEFYKAFTQGGIFFLDEIDNSDPSSLIVLNSALANGYMSFPHETVERHKNFRMIAAANTFGKGSDLQYVGRNPLDGSTLDRFGNIYFDYDRKLEEKLYPSKELLEFMWALREACSETRTLHIVSTRGIGKLYEKEINGLPIKLGLETDVIKSLSQDEINILSNAMKKKVTPGNKYYEGFKTYKLGR